jgi:hypothetical protein
MGDVVKIRPDMPEPTGRGGNYHENWIEFGDMIVVRHASTRFWARVVGVTVAGHLTVQVRNETGIAGLHFDKTIAVLLEEHDGMAVWVPAS